MCGRFTLRTPLNVLVRDFEAQIADDRPLLPRFNIAPTQDVPVVRAADDGRELTLMHWGLIPVWSKDKKISYGTINARADTVATKPAFRSAYKKRRCLILADGYFEWAKKGKLKQPYLYEIDGGDAFAFAGIWETWYGGPGVEGEPLESCSIITTDANSLAAEIHDRMPVILDKADYPRWLDARLENPADLLKQIPAERMSVRAVSTYVNNARHSGEECVAPREDDE